jgi:hypothetical protein
MNARLGTFWSAAHRVVDGFIARLPAFWAAIILFRCFTSRVCQNLGRLFGRLNSGAIILLGLLVTFSIVQRQNLP